MVRDGHALLDAALRRAERVRTAVIAMPGLRLMGPEVVEQGLTAELDLLKITIDVRELGISGMQATEWLRAHCHVDIGSSDTCRISAQITHSDDDRTENLLIDSLDRLVQHAGTLESQPPVRLPAPRALQLEQAMLPREAFFAPAEHVPSDRAVGRVAAETISPYPPGVPVVAPGEVITGEVVDYLTSGVAAGMLIPDAADPTARTFRVTATR
jgi:arginine/lysine/ornithine decarboxylase